MHILTVLVLSGLVLLLLNLPIRSAGNEQENKYVRGKCGKPQVAPSKGHRIVGGGFVHNNSWPWACAMVQEVRRAKGMTYRQFCDCTLIHNEWVMTAAHCLEGLTKAQFIYYVKIYVGVENLNRAVYESRFRYNVSDVIKHEKFVMASKDYDIAMVKLHRPIDLIDNDTLPACLPNHYVSDTSEGEFEQTADKGRKRCYIGGWGHTYEGQQGKQGFVGSGTDFLKQTSCGIFSREDCKRTKLPTTDRMFCAGFDEGKQDTCQGDSGGPLVCDEGNSTWVVHGIVSWGAGCARAGAPGIYTNVWAMKPWIQNKTGIIFDYHAQNADLDDGP